MQSAIIDGQWCVNVHLYGTLGSSLLSLPSSIDHSHPLIFTIIPLSLPFLSSDPPLPSLSTAYHLKYLDQIGDTYFGLKVNNAGGDVGPLSGGGGIMEGLFSMLGGDTGEGDQGLGGLGEGGDG